MRANACFVPAYLVLLVGLGVGLPAALGGMFGSNHKGTSGHLNTKAIEHELTYGQVANYLFKVEPTNGLEANVRAVAGMLSERPEASPYLIKLVNAIEALKGPNENKEIFCGRANLANLRVAAEAMQHDGNLGPDNAPDPIRRLNGILIKQIADAWSVCPEHLEGKFDEYKKTLNRGYSQNVRHLHRLPLSYIYLNKTGQSWEEEGRIFEEALSDMLWRKDVWHKRTVAGMLEGLLVSCRHFLYMEDSDPFVEKPIGLSARYLDLLIVNHLMMGTFYADWKVRPANYSELVRAVPQLNQQMTEWALNYGACARLNATGESELVKHIVNARKRAGKRKHGAKIGGLGGCGLFC